MNCDKHGIKVKTKSDQIVLFMNETFYDPNMLFNPTAKFLET